MKRILLTAALIFILHASVLAQEHPKGEVFGGYSYLRSTDPGINFNGWNASITGNLNSWFGVEADFSGHHGSPFPDLFGAPLPVSVPGLPKVNVHSFLFGPKFTHRANKAVTPYGHVLFGGTRASFGAFGLSINDTAFAALAGGGLDVRVNDMLAVRALQADYLVTRFGGEAQHNLRLSFGVVLRFGY